jgi:tRNA (cmo5U34)-methyltransferase
MSHSARKHLHLENDAYDEAIRRFIPSYETMLGVAAGAVAAAEPLHVVELGAGTGALSEALLAHAAIGSVELIDVDPEMLAQARQRLARFGERVRFTQGSYDQALPAADACAASLALHHIATLAEKAAFYRRAFEALRPGGVLVNADVNMPPESVERERLFQHWSVHMMAAGIAEARAWQYFDEWSAEDTYLPLEAELAELARAGFTAERIWNDGAVGVVVASKPLGQKIAK